jgi:hypothetical protein
VLFISVALVPSACMAGPLVGVLVIDSPPTISGDTLPEFCNTVPAGTLVVIPQEVRDKWNSQIVTDEELIHAVSTPGLYPGVNKSVVVVTNDTETRDTLSIYASAEKGVVITRSPFTTSGTLHSVLAYAPSTQMDSAENTVQYISEDDALIVGMEDCPFDHPITNRNSPVSVVGSSPYNSEGFVINPVTMQGTQNSGNGFTFPVTQASLTATSPAMAFTSLPFSSSPLAPFTPSVQPGGHVEAQFGTEPSSEFTYHESQSADGVINGFSYPAGFTVN